MIHLRLLVLKIMYEKLTFLVLEVSNLCYIHIIFQMALATLRTQAK